MCYSAMVRQGAKKMARHFRASPDYGQIELIFEQRLDTMALRIPRVFEDEFAAPENAQERRIRDLIHAYRAKVTSESEQELFKQRKRLSDAERKLKDKETKAALESARIAADKVEKLMAKLADLTRTEARTRDGRIFPMWFAPILIQEDGARKLVLARYHCRPKGKPEFYDRKYPGLYNARRDNIDGFWAGQFGKTHALMVVTSFFENVERNGKNAVLQFMPDNGADMLIACLYSRWGDAGTGELISFAAVTDEPPAEVAAAGHDRMIVSLKEENVDTWLAPGELDSRALHQILEDVERPLYEHREAA